MKLTKKILAVLASAVMMTGSVSSVSAATYGTCPFSYAQGQASMGFEDRLVLNDTNKKMFIVKASDGTVLTENKLEFKDNVSCNELKVYETKQSFVSSERYIERTMMMQYSTDLTGHRMLWSKKLGNYWSGDIYEVPEHLTITQELPNSLDGSFQGVSQVFDYKTAR